MILEQATIKSIKRLEAINQPICTFARFGLLGGFNGGIEKVIQQMTASLNRQIQKEVRNERIESH